MDYVQLSKELIRSIRGHRSQRAWSMRLGYRSNVYAPWEQGRRWPTAAEFFRACATSGVDVRAAWARFFATAPPDWLETLDPTTTRGVAALLDEIRGDQSAREIADAAGFGRHSVYRWMTGRTEPRLPDFLRVFEAGSTRLLDLLSEIVDLSTLDSVSETWGRIEARRNGAATHPWTQAILRAIELEAYLSLPAHEPGWIAQRLGISEEEEARCISFLKDTDQVVWTGTHYRGRTLAVDLRGRSTIARALKTHWAEEAVNRLESGAPGQFSYLCFSVSREDMERIREHHLRYYNTIRSIISESEPNEVVCVANVQLFALESNV